MRRLGGGGKLAVAGVMAALSSCLGSPDFFGDGRDAGIDAGRPHAGGTGGGGAVDGGTGGSGGSRPDGGIFAVVRASRSSSVASARGHIVAVNPDLPALVVDGRSLPLFPPGSEPTALAALPNGDLVVTLRALQELAYVKSEPSYEVVWRVQVCSEPAGVAVSPSGRTAVVACLGEARAVFVDTATRGRTPVTLQGTARAVAITNNGDAEDSDERAYVPLFYGALLGEGTDRGREGRVHEIDLASRMVTATLTLAPIADLGYGPTVNGVEGPHPACAPNQLYAIAIAKGRAWVTHSCVSPEAPLQKLTTLGSAISVIDLPGRRELPTQSTTLGRMLRMVAAPEMHSLMGVPIDVDVDPEGRRVVVLSQAANRLLFLDVTQPQAPVPLLRGLVEPSLSLSGQGPCAYPSPCFDAGFSFGDGGVPDGVPNGLVLAGDFVAIANDWTGRQLVTVFLDGRVASQRYAMPPPTGTPERAALMGKKFFFTGLDRWSFRDVGSCGSCHPDGLSDNVTWMFPAGPRQTPSLDGTFAKADKADHRAQNWTAIFDEIYDVEGVTRNVLGGRGAIVYPGMDFPIPLSQGVSFDGGAYSRSDGLSGSAAETDRRLSFIHEWSEIEAYVQGVRANRAPIWPDPEPARRGRILFAVAGCAKCHGGAKWTVSRVPYEPSPQKNGSLPGDNNLPAMPTGLRTELRDGGDWLPYNRDAFKVAVERIAVDGGPDVVVGPERITCVLRDVGTYDLANPLERKPDGTRAQGALGFNPPSLLGLATSAPFFHHGEAATLADVLAPRYGRHAAAGQGAFALVLGPAEIADLSAFLESIDGDTMPFAPAELVDLCGGY